MPEPGKDMAVWIGGAPKHVRVLQYSYQFLLPHFC